MKNTKKSLLMSVVSLLLCFSMLLGTTWAWFTDSVSSGSNVIQSGNLDLDVQYTLDGETWNDLDGADDLFQKGLWEPGHTEVVALRITNKGSLALKYSASMNIIKETVGKNKDGGDIVLSDILTVSTLTQQANEIGDITVSLAFTGENTVAYNEPVAFKVGNVLEDDKQLLPGDAHYVLVKVDMPDTVGNEANHDGVNVPKIEFGINVLATQSPYESDSFGNEYDKDATFDDFANTNILATETKTLVAGENSIEFDLSNEGLKIAKVTVPADAIADPMQPVTVTFDGIERQITGENIEGYAYDIKVTNLKSGLTGDQLVTVVVEAPKALAAMQAYHNGVLIEDAVYDEVEGTVTFKTASFSPYDFTATVIQVSTLADIRDAVKQSNMELRLMADLTIDLTAGGADRSADHVLTSGSKTYYNAVNIIGENVAIDLNGHTITVKCSNAYNGNQDVGALFYVNESGSLNIVDRVGNGFIKMASSIYMVWAPYDTPSYVDIYSGAFIADSYAGDPIGTSNDPDSEDGTMENENSNRALIYAGKGGNMNIYGGYFLYNNTPNDVLNRNNGAFNSTNGYEGDRPFITIHEGVMLIDKAYRQDPTHTSEFKNILKEHPDAKPTDEGIMDNSSIKLAKDCEIAETDLVTPVTIDGVSYKTWYKVIMDIISISAKPLKGVYDKDHVFTNDDFAVYATSKNGSSGKITSFTFVETAETADSKTFTISYTDDFGDVMTATCTVSINSLTLLEDRIRLPIADPNNTSIKAPFFSTGGFNVSGWAHLVNSAYTYDYFANNNLTYTAPNGERVSGFNNEYGEWGNTYWGNFVEGKYSEGYYGLTIDNAKSYTTLGINCVVGCLEDAPQLKGFGYYIGDDLSTLQWTAPAIVYTEGDMYNSFGWNNGHSLLEMNCGTFQPGESYTVHWVLVFEDGMSPLADWTVNMAEASENDATFIDTEKPNANVIIMAGQSNMFGPAPLTQDIIDNYASLDYSNVFIKYANINFDVAPDGSILGSLSTIFSNDDFEKYCVGIGAQGTTYFGPELALAYSLATNTALNGENWYIIKYAAAGTALGSQWTSGCTIDGKNTNLTDDMLAYVQDALDSLEKEGYDVRIRSFMWMQGESDAATEATANNYAALEEALVNRVRDTFAGYATRATSALQVPGSGISFINAGIANNDSKQPATGGTGPNDWIYSLEVNRSKISNSQWLCSLIGASSDSPLTEGPLKGYVFGLNVPTIANPDQSGAIVNSIYIDTSHLLSKKTAHELDPSDPLYEDYGNESDNTDWAHYCASSMRTLGELYSSCLHYMINQNG